MALHGDIKVNNRVIGGWEAQRITTAPDGINTYRWETWRTALHEDGLSPVYRGELQHDYRDGAMALAAKVLLAADEQMAGEQ